ncbi:hypothetical protein C9374_012972 [Naegleria lovaniensis]|uniref:Right handed beta helix domain-containing protein n=1 Tax=Naegleria lovaniensis TaxID=51637 RepID=A0AA88GC59_NAELO|nr:uncharacterized protein C9374_012972 [Naegleria lovaniensis]KAG2372942.1 hypothetical protein C9374_012972 [Naegleria lovaniensis]
MLSSTVKAPVACLVVLFFLIHAYFVSIVDGQNPTVNIYVSNANGLDTNNGTSSLWPLKTLSKAASVVQSSKNSLFVNTTFTVLIDDGRYFVPNGLIIPASAKLNNQYSPVIWKPGKEDGNVRITGGLPLAPSFWQVVTVANNPSVYNMLPTVAQGKVLSCNLTLAGLSKSQIFQFVKTGYSKKFVSSGNELFYKGKAQTVARFPNKFPNGEDQFLRFTGTNGVNTFQFNSTVSHNRFKWSLERSPYAFSFFYHDWADSTEDLKFITQDGFAELNVNVTYGIRSNQRFYLVNFLSELDQPGEYILQDDVIYYWPAGPIVEQDDIIISTADHLINVQAHAQQFQSLRIEMTRGYAIRSFKVDYTVVRSSTISNTGSRGVAFDFCTGCQFISNHVFETGLGAVYIFGGDRITLTPSGILVYNNIIYNFTRNGKAYRAGVELKGVGVTVKNNEIFNADHAAIIWEGNNHDFAYNYIHDVCKTTGDSGAVYSYADWAARGTVVRYNHIARVNGPGLWGTSGVYLDDQLSSITMYGNIFSAVYNGFQLGGGRDNIVFGNIFINNTTPIHADSRGLLGVYDSTTRMNRLLSLPYNSSDVWISSYPKLPNILNDEPQAPKGNSVQFNIIIGSTSKDFIVANFTKYSIYGNNTFKLPESIFVDAQNGNFTLLPNSTIARMLNYTQIPFNDIGLVYPKSDVVPPVAPSPKLSTSTPTQPSRSIPKKVSASHRAVGHLVCSVIVMLVTIFLIRLN